MAQNDPERAKEMKRKHRLAHKERAKEHRKLRYEQEANRSREKRKVHFFRTASYSLKRRSGVTISPITLWRVWKKQRGLCAITGRPLDGRTPKATAIDHIIPISRNGETVQENLQWTNYEANMRKGNLTMQEFINFCKDTVIHANIMETT